jgi:hypothetical protein
MKVKLMGGPCMGKIVELPPNAMYSQMYHVAWSNPTAAQWSRFDVSPTTDIQINQGYYKPSKKPGVWTFVGSYEGDKYKSFERRFKAWQRKVRKLSEHGVPYDQWPPRPSR